MRTKRQIRWRPRALLLALALIACDTESSRNPMGPTPPGPPAAAIVGLQLNGPDTVHLDEAVQFTVVALRSDNSTSDVTTEVSWNAFPTAFMTMSTPGQFTGRAIGEPRISVAAGGRSATKNVIVVPPGTFRLKGTVRDAGVPIAAQVRIENQALGTRDIDAVSGQYLVYGVAGETRITVTKSGYQEQSRTESIGEHRTIDIDLALSRSRADVSGTYALRITAADTCSALPDDVRSRTFTASIAQNGADLTVTLSGPEFATISGRTLNQFKGFLEAERAVFRFTSGSSGFYYYYYSPDVLEFLSIGRYFGWEGTATTSVSRDVLAGTMNGSLGTYSGPFRATLRCQSNQHRFELSR